MTRIPRPAIALIGLSLAAVAFTGCSDESSADDKGGSAAAGSCDPADVKLVGQVRNESNPYEAAWLDGGDAFAEGSTWSSSDSPTTATRPSSRSRSASSSRATPTASS